MTKLALEAVRRLVALGAQLTIWTRVRVWARVSVWTPSRDAVRVSWWVALSATLVFAAMGARFVVCVDRDRSTARGLTHLASLAADLSDISALAQRAAGDGAPDERRLRARRMTVEARLAALDGADGDEIRALPIFAALEAAAHDVTATLAPLAARDLREADRRATIEALAARLAGEDGVRMADAVSAAREAIVALADRVERRSRLDAALFVAALGLYAPLMVFAVLRPLTRRVVERERSEADARQIADEQARAKRDFLAIMSHELRTPLHGVIGNAELLGAADLGPQDRARVDAIGASARDLLRVLNDVLDVVGVDRAQELGRPSRVSIDEFAASALAMVAPRARRAGLDLALSIDPRAPRRLRAEAGAIRKILLVLLENAVKFTASGGLSLTIERLPTPVVAPDADFDAPAALRFTVSDSGVGVAREARSRIFEPFVQGADSRTRSVGGAGLGLAIARDLARRIGSEVKLDSAPGAGAAFWFDVVVDALTDAAPAAPLAGRRLLLIDRDTPAARARVRALEAAGASVRTAWSVSEGLAALAATGSAETSLGLAPIEAVLAHRDAPGLDIGSLEEASSAPRLFYGLRSAEGEAAAMLEASAPDGWSEAILAGIARGLLRRPEPRMTETRMTETRMTETHAPEAGALEARAFAAPVSETRATTEPPPPARGRALVVGPSRAGRRAMRLAFEGAGFAVDEAEEASDAGSLTAEVDYRVVALDVVGAGGEEAALEIAEALRAPSGASADAAILLATSEPRRVDARRAARLGLAAVLEKPVDLTALVRVALERAPARAAA